MKSRKDAQFSGGRDGTHWSQFTWLEIEQSYIGVSIEGGIFLARKPDTNTREVFTKTRGLPRKGMRCSLGCTSLFSHRRWVTRWNIALSLISRNCWCSWRADSSEDMRFAHRIGRSSITPAANHPHSWNIFIAHSI